MDCQEGKVRKGGVNKKPRSKKSKVKLVGQGELDIAGITMSRIFQKIRIEKARQDKKWGEQNYLPFKWCAILSEKYCEVCRAALDNKFDDYEKGLVQIAAVAVATLECLVRAKEIPKKPKRPTGRLITEGFPPPECVLKGKSHKE